ncbi:DEHA2A13046p [Debaryomyces hansenii CBS767]|uniref:DEHA2A13046p n=1 Tax=Debaryomyces hansenii (strain ATCC 36239 / CBS 767 / BCRC 21394 / JCM 1990 / NBRC 0083 / IGC 2968) TaxID=284592 RepID=Q6BY23_DEBHA|nr:DEHA2A13046p [Debaryomyces hansenii CBS767]CAG84873.2 DEHA2A13046p [Debaryomyces hansenii CBS767]|eukprot:XP_456896.2 DEHA2A13046p [Debaryomyces hansenii CBS767]
MNFLSKTFSTLTGSSIPYTIKDKVVDPLLSHPDTRPIWTIYDGLNPKNDNAPVTIFEFNLKDPVNIQNDYIALARNCFKKVKLIKHPGIISVIDFIENDNFLYIVTEQVVPLKSYLGNNKTQISEDAKLFGIYSIGQSLSFINMKCHCLHGNIDVNNSIFVTSAGDWKLFGFELLTNLNSDPDQPIYRYSNRLPVFKNNVPEDVLNQGVDSIRQFPIKFDSFLYGAFIYKVLTLETFDNKIQQSELLTPNSKIPKQLNVNFKRLVSNKPNLRTTIDKFLNDSNSFFSSNKIVQFNTQLEEIKFKNEEEKREFFKYGLAAYLSDTDSIQFPPGLLDYKLLPELVGQFDTLSKIAPSINSTPEEHQQKQETISVILHYLLKFGSTLPPDIFNKSVKPIIFKTFGLADRTIRLNLLTHLPSYSAYLTESDIQSKIFYDMISGFQDTNFMIRETTLKSITTIIDKISVKQVNQDLLKVLAKSQMDPKPSIRTNTLILIIKISDKIYKNSKNNVLITALSKSLRDSFTPCKMMALSGFEKLIEEFSLDEICGKILGHLAISLMDNKSYKVRVEAKRVFNLYLQSVERHSATLPQDEEDEDSEEKEFFKKYAPMNKDVKEKVTEAPVSNSTFGWNVVNKLISTSAVDGKLNNDFNSSTPDLTRAASPSTNNINSNSKDLNNNNDNANDWNYEDDGWNEDTDLETENNTLKEPKELPEKKVLSTPAKTHKKASTLKLGSKQQKNPGSTLKLNLAVEEDDGWGDSADW